MVKKMMLLYQYFLILSIQVTAFSPIVLSPFLSGRGHPRFLPPVPTTATTISCPSPSSLPPKLSKSQSTQQQPRKKKLEDYLYTDYEPKVKEVLLRLDAEEKASGKQDDDFDELSSYAWDIHDNFEEKVLPRPIPSLKDRLLYQHLCQEEEREALLGIPQEDSDDPPPFNPKKFRRDPRELTLLEQIELWPPWVIWQDRHVLMKDMEIPNLGETFLYAVGVSSIFTLILLLHWEFTQFVFRRRHFWGLLQPGMKFVFRHDRKYSYVERTVSNVGLQTS